MMSYTMKKLIVALLLLFTTILLVGISFYFYKTADNIAQGKDEITIELEDVKTGTDLSDMVKQADMIVLGSYKSHHSTINMARDPEAMNKESTDKYIAGKVFRFKVKENLKGQLDEEMIKIAHRLSVPFEIEEILGYRDEEVEDVDPTYIKPVYDKTYIVFLKKGFVDDIYVRAIEPFLIAVNEENEVEMKSNIVEEIDFKERKSVV